MLITALIIKVKKRKEPFPFSKYLLNTCSVIDFHLSAWDISEEDKFPILREFMVQWGRQK